MTSVRSQKDTKIDALIKGVVDSLVSVTPKGHVHFIRLPMIYPTGSTAIVQIKQQGGNFTVSDGGSAYVEASDVGLTNSFGQLARKYAEKYSIIYEKNAFFREGVRADQLRSVIIMIASAGVETLSHSVDNLKAENDSSLGDALVSKLLSAFQDNFVERNRKFNGASGHEWEFSSFVRLSNRSAVFETVTPYASSVTNAAAKFFDVSRLANPPIRVSVIRSYEGFGDFANLLQQTSTVVQIAEPADKFRKLIEAAS